MDRSVKKIMKKGQNPNFCGPGEVCARMCQAKIC
jgi:hypothetical protein